jgi:hypothetical protein
MVYTAPVVQGEHMAFCLSGSGPHAAAGEPEAGIRHEDFGASADGK